MNLAWVLSVTGQHCPTCIAASLQIHPADVWAAAGLKPGSHSLFCKESCKCRFVETTEEERGEINDIPIRDTADVSGQLAQITLAATATKTGFEILAITKGIGNGWDFPAEVLKESVQLWDNCECFIDHSLNNRSIKDLAGVCTEPTWDEETAGIKLALKPFGPAAEMLSAIGKEFLSHTKSNIGFSADLVLNAKGKRVDRIVKVNSVDLVYKPARGGAFIRALNSTQGVNMSEENSNQVIPPQPEDEKVKAIQLSLCAQLLDAGLVNASLPKPIENRVRAQFAGKTFEPAELTAAISESRQLLSDLTASNTVKGIRVTNMVNTDDQLKAAVSDMFDLPRDPGMENIKPARLSGIRELYHLLTGDYEMVGGYHPSRIQLATTADFGGLVKNALNKMVKINWEELGRAGYNWWERIVTQEHFNSLQDITGTLVGSVGALPEVLEGAEYPELVIGDSPETATWTKRGGYIPLTLELIDRDETRKLKAYPRELANAGLRTISSIVAALFTSNSAVGPTMADNGALFNATAVTTKGGHANLLTTALSEAQLEVVKAAVYNQPMLVKNDTGLYGTGSKIAVDPRYLLVPRALQLTAMKLVYPTLQNTASIYSENQQRGAPGDVITVPEWTDATDWAMVADPRIIPGIFVGNRFGLMPEIFIAGDELSPAMFTNDEHRIKVRFFAAVWVNDFRPLHKSNVAG